MDDIFKIIVGAIIGILIIGGVVMIFTPHTAVPTNETNETNATNESVVEVVQDKISDFAQDGQVSFTNKNNTTYTLTSSNSSNAASGNNNLAASNNSSVAGGYVEQNYQAGNGQFYQINYKDGNFRQYDTKTGELIGSSFDEDQEKLGVIDGQML